jgi:hypothetical protein
MNARDAIPFMGQVAILLECDYWHQSVEIVPVSRFNPGLDWHRYDELVQDADIAFKEFLTIAKGDVSDLLTPEFLQFKRIFDISNEYSDLNVARSKPTNRPRAGHRKQPL